MDISFARFSPTVKQNEEQIVNMDGMEKSGNLKRIKDVLVNLSNGFPGREYINYRMFTLFEGFNYFMILVCFKLLFKGFIIR